MAARRVRGSAGMVTAEVAVLLPALVALVVLGLRAVGVARVALGCSDGARAAVRAAARDEPEPVVVSAARLQCGDQAEVRVERGDSQVRVEVHAQARLAPGLQVPVTVSAVAAREGAP